VRVHDIKFAPEERLSGRSGHSSVRVQWLGTAGFRIEFEKHVVLIDPYVTRASLAQCVLGPLRPDIASIARWVDRADAILVGHTHFDHVLDVPAIALHTGAHVYGSWSAARLCLAQGVAPQCVHIVDASANGPASLIESGPFRIRFVPSKHSCLFAGRAPFPGDIVSCDGAPMRMDRYRCGAVFVIELEVDGRLLVHHGSARRDDATPQARADLVMLCTAGWKSSREYPERMIRAYRPGAVLLSHWDNFFRPMGEGAHRLPMMSLDRLAERIRASAPNTRVGTTELMGSVLV
jgi:L-ascorbate metabolism protein UlaG (beta-lactamase superfamily)